MSWRPRVVVPREHAARQRTRLLPALAGHRDARTQQGELQSLRVELACLSDLTVGLSEPLLVDEERAVPGAYRQVGRAQGESTLEVSLGFFGAPGEVSGLRGVEVQWTAVGVDLEASERYLPPFLATSEADQRERAELEGASLVGFRRALGGRSRQRCGLPAVPQCLPRHGSSSRQGRSVVPPSHHRTPTHSAPRCQSRPCPVAARDAGHVPAWCPGRGALSCESRSSPC